jgi:A/G-specific adenine glycosylase
MRTFFARKLLQWHADHPRPLPWDDGPRDVYHIWISEVIMQQTRIEQGAAYYKRFIERFPDVHSLASASPDEVLRYWQGLGYYTRARNLHKAAKVVLEEHDGNFPNTFDGLIRLPGIGPYSAAAIASFAFGLPYPVVDGNVKRVASRFAGIVEPVDLPATHETIRKEVGKWMKGAHPAEFNQAIMNFGALVCKPKNPLCTTCVLQEKCYAFQNGMTDQLPARMKIKSNTLRYLHFVIMQYRGHVLLERREGKDIWRGLYTPPILELNHPRKPTAKQIASLVKKWTGTEVEHSSASGELIKQQLTHQTLYMTFYTVRLVSSPKAMPENAVWISQKNIQQLGRPKVIAEGMKW